MGEGEKMKKKSALCKRPYFLSGCVVKVLRAKVHIMLENSFFHVDSFSFVLQVDNSKEEGGREGAI